MFADVVVLAREMNLGRVWEISDQIKHDNLKGPSGELVRHEMFVHGTTSINTTTITPKTWPSCYPIILNNKITIDPITIGINISDASQSSPNILEIL
jgi:hypothetical protein